MNDLLKQVKGLQDAELMARLDELTRTERENLADIVAHLAEFDLRRLWEPSAASLFKYCVNKYGYSEDVAVNRITAARKTLQFPLILQLMRCGRLHLAAVRILGPHLTQGNHEDLLIRASGMSLREVEVLVAHIAPRADIADHIQRLPQATSPVLQTALIQTTPICSSTVLPLVGLSKQRITAIAPDRFHFGFTAGEALVGKIKRARSLLWHKFPKGNLEDIVNEALEDLLDKRDPERKALRTRKKKPAPSEGRRIPEWVKHEVWKRDGGKCVHQAPEGGQCGEESGLEYDHVIPFARGGRSDEPGNIRLLCRTHNQANARKEFGEAASRHVRH